jgi:hypothetical protein
MEYWIGCRNPYSEDGFLQRGSGFGGRSRSPGNYGCEVRANERDIEGDVCFGCGDDRFGCGVFERVPKAICAAGAAYEERD